MANPRTGRVLVVAVAAIVACSTGAIVATYSRLSHTWDEGTHVSAGLELLQDRRYTLQTENPPVSRVVLAVIPYLNGARLSPTAPRGPGAAAVGAEMFYRTPDYVRNVTEARVANLLFFWACVVLTWVLAGGRSDPWVAFLASSIVATLPPIVAHSGFATTDVAFVASFLLALAALRRFLNRPAMGSATLAGAAIGLAVATKFSTIGFLPPVAAAVVLSHYWDRRTLWVAALKTAMPWKAIAASGVAALLVIWACYGFDVGRLSDLPQRFGGNGQMATTGFVGAIRDWRLPGHEFLHGLMWLRAHTIAGDATAMFGEFSRRGFLLFYPIVLATKAPLPFLLFAAVGLLGVIRYRHDPRWKWFVGLPLGAFGILLVSMTSPINLGVRHVMVIYPLVALAAAFGLVRWTEQSARRWIGLGFGGACLLLQLGLLLSSVPDQIAYFNVFAGSEPGNISSDSDFDWGQDALAMQQYFAAHPVPELYVLIGGTTRKCSLQLPPMKALPTHPVSGWIAISERPFRLNRGVIREDPCDMPGSPGRTVNAPPGWLDWLKRYEPVAIIGKTIRVYHVPGS